MNFISLFDMLKHVRGEEVGNNKFLTEYFNIVVDTCYVNDHCAYESGVKINDDDWIIVERYDDFDSAKEGHGFWVNHVKNREFVLVDIDLREVYHYCGNAAIEGE
jgi:hypothetical protein